MVCKTQHSAGVISDAGQPRPVGGEALGSEHQTDRHTDRESLMLIPLTSMQGS